MKVSDLTKILETICKKAENSLCADCNNKNPTWASIDFGVLVCLNCSGAHRALGPSITRVRSTSLDQWQQAWIDFFSEGNIKINQFLQYNLNKNKKPCSNSSQEYINSFVHDKYVKRKYINPGTNDPMSRVKGNKIQKMEPKNTKQQNPKSKQVSFQKQRNNEQIQKIFKTNANQFIKAATNFQSYNPKSKDSKRQICSLKVLTNTIKQTKKKSKDVDFDFDFDKAKTKKECKNEGFVESFNQFAFAKAQSLNNNYTNKFDFGTLKQPSKTTKQLQNCEQQSLSEKKQRQFTFQDVFSQTVPPSKPPKTRNIDPFGILL